MKGKLDRLPRVALSESDLAQVEAAHKRLIKRCRKAVDSWPKYKKISVSNWLDERPVIKRKK